MRIETKQSKNYQKNNWNSVKSSVTLTKLVCRAHSGFVHNYNSNTMKISFEVKCYKKFVTVENKRSVPWVATVLSSEIAIRVHCKLFESKCIANAGISLTDPHQSPAMVLIKNCYC